MSTQPHFGTQFAARSEALRQFEDYAITVNQLIQLCARVLQSNQQVTTLLRQIQAMSPQNQSFNLQYLMLQENMQQEQRQFTLLSNILKTRHDGAKNVISNVR
jgi:hypothetical protein